MIAVNSITKLGAVGALVLGSPVQAAITAAGHTPKVNTHWNYVVRASSGGKPAKGTITAQIVDPIGGVHPVQFGASTKNITNVPFNGTFRGYIIWPTSSRGVPVRLRFTLKIAKVQKVVSYSVTPQA